MRIQGSKNKMQLTLREWEKERVYLLKAHKKGLKLWKILIKKI